MNRQSWKNQQSKDCLHTSALPWVTFGHISSVALKIELNTDHVKVSSSLLRKYMFLWPGSRHCQDPYFVSWSHTFLPVYLVSMLVGLHTLHKRGGVCLAYGNARANGSEYRDEFSLAFSFDVRKLQLHPSQKEYEHTFFCIYTKYFRVVTSFWSHNGTHKEKASGTIVTHLAPPRASCLFPET